MQQGFVVPGDKSLSHRALLFATLCDGPCELSGLLTGADVQSTASAMRMLGADIPELNAQHVRVTPPQQFLTPTGPIDCGNSGTTIRLLSGLLAGMGISATLTGDASLQRRPMGRVIDPLRLMGASIAGNAQGRAPLTITPAQVPLRGIDYAMPVASAQVKSAMLLAGLFAEGTLTLHEPAASRNHTELMLQAMGVPVVVSGLTVTMPCGALRQGRLPAFSFQVPGDFSSAAFFIVLALLAGFQPGLNIPSPLVFQHVGLGPQRIGLMRVLQALGGTIAIENATTSCGEPLGNLVVQPSRLQGNLTLTEAEIPALIDEIPILMIAGLFNTGTLTVTGAEELRHKESDRLAVMTQNLRLLGIGEEILQETPDGFVLHGLGAQPERLRALQPAGMLQVAHDHRIAMALSILNALVSPAITWPLDGPEWVSISFPQFYNLLENFKA